MVNQVISSGKKIGKLINGKPNIKFLNLNMKKRTAVKHEKKRKLINITEVMWSTNIKISCLMKE
jgi:hypothetical protein